MLPKTPFSTRLSGSAKEMELRLRNILQWKKQRPPVWAMVLTTLVILFCGNLVSCKPAQTSTVQAEAAVQDSVAGPLTYVSGNMDPWWNGTYYTRAHNELLSPYLEDYSQLPAPIETLLSGLTVDELPTTLTDVNAAKLSDSWNDCVWLLAQDSTNDVALYGVAVTNGSPANCKDFQTGGIILRHGDSWAYCPEYWDCRYGAVPQLSVRDWDRDGTLEAAVIFPQGMGEGVWTESLLLFELDDFSWLRPDYGQFTDTVAVAYLPDVDKLQISMGDTSCTVNISDTNIWGKAVGYQMVDLGSSHTSYSLTDSGITAWFGLDVGAWTQGWLCADLTFDGTNYVFTDPLLLSTDETDDGSALPVSYVANSEKS